MLVQQFVVIDLHHTIGVQQVCAGKPKFGVAIGDHDADVIPRCRIAVDIEGPGVRRVGDVFKKGVARRYGKIRRHRVGWVAFDDSEYNLPIGPEQRHNRHAVRGKRRLHLHHLHEAIRAEDQIPILISDQQRHAVHIVIAQPDTEFEGLRLHIGPGRHALDAAFQQLARRCRDRQHRRFVRLACVRVGHFDHLVFAQEHLMRGMRCIGLVLVHPRRGLVHMFADVIARDVIGSAKHTIRTRPVRRAKNAIRPRLVRRAGHHHEVVGAGGGVIQRIIRRQRDEHGARPALGHKVKAVVEELPEQRHPGVERRRQAFIRRDVGDADVDVALGRGIEVDVVLRQRAGEFCTRSNDTIGRRGVIIQDGQIRLVVGDDRLCCRHDLG